MEKEELIKILETMSFEKIKRFRIVFEVEYDVKILEFENDEY